MCDSLLGACKLTIEVNNLYKKDSLLTTTGPLATTAPFSIHLLRSVVNYRRFLSLKSFGIYMFVQTTALFVILSYKLVTGLAVREAPNDNRVTQIVQSQRPEGLCHRTRSLHIL